MDKYFKFKKNPDGIAELIFDNAEERINKLSADLMSEFNVLLDQLQNEKNIKVLIIKSTKKDIFFVGADIHEIAAIKSIEEASEKSGNGQDILIKLENLPYPTVCFIDGACVGGGLELALACTYRVVSDNKKTQLGLPEVTLGFIPGFGGTKRLPKLVGLRQGISMIASGKSVDAKKAFKIKLADAIYPASNFNSYADSFVKKVLSVNGKKELEQKRRRKFSERIIESNPLTRMILYSVAKKDILKKTGGHYPSPLVAVSVIKKTYKRSMKFTMKRENEAFAKLAVSPISKKMVSLFLTGDSLKKEYKTTEKINAVNSLAVLGAGKMGGSIAWLAINASMPVRLKDITWEAVGNGLAAIADIYNDLLKIKKTDNREADLKKNYVSGTLDYSGFAGIDFVIEAIVEDQDVKIKTFKELEEYLGPDAIIATNTSSLSVTEMARSLQHPERFIGFHFFNPANRMPLIEVVPGEKTSQETVLRSVEFARKLGKTPIVLKDCNGFLVNRILMAYLNESLLMLEEGVDFDVIDRAMLSYGMPMGPFALFDEIGIKVGFKIAKLFSVFYPERFKIIKIQHDFENVKQLSGKSSGVGFYVYRNKNKKPNPLIAKILKENGINFNIKISPDEIIERSILMMINEASLCIEEGIIDKARYLDFAMLIGTGFPAFRGGLLATADEMGIENIVTKLKQYEVKYGKRFKPTNLLVEMSNNKERFYYEI